MDADLWYGSNGHGPEGRAFRFLKKLFLMEVSVLEGMGYTYEEALERVLRQGKLVTVHSFQRLRVPLVALLRPPSPSFTHMYEKIYLSNVVTYKTTSPSSENSTPILYIHGGGFFSGDFGSYQNFIERLHQGTHRTIFFPHYRLLPEHSIEDALDDLLTVYTLLTTQYGNTLEVLSDSAGSLLTLNLLSRLAPTLCPKRVFLLSPVTNLMLETPSNDSFLTCSQTKWVFNTLFKGMVEVPPSPLGSSVTGSTRSVARRQDDAKHVYSPSAFYTTLHLSTTLYILMGDNELFYNDNLKFIEQVRFGGGRVGSYCFPHRFHAWFLFLEAPTFFTTLSLLLGRGLYE